MDFSALMLPLVIALLVILAGFTIYWGGGRFANWSQQARRRTVWITGLATIVVTAFVFVAEQTIRRETVFEVSGSWDEIIDRPFEIQLTDRDGEHHLSVSPRLRGPKGIDHTPVLRVRLQSPSGQIILDEERLYRRSRFQQDSSSVLATGSTFGASFVPDLGGSYRLLITSSDSSGPPIFIRVSKK